MINFKKKVVSVAVLSVLLAPTVSTPFLYSTQVLAEEKADTPKKIEDTKENTSTEKKDNGNTISSVVEKESTILSDSSVFNIQIGYQFEDGSFDEWQRGTGFLVNNQEILTIQTLADTSTSSSLYKAILDKKADAYKTAGIDLKNEDEVEKHFKIRVTNTDGEVLAVKDSSAKNGLGLISLEKTSPSTPAVFEEEADVNSAEGTKYKMKLSALNNNKAEISETEGTLVKPAANAASGTLAMSADSSKGDVAGAPVYNEGGNIVGMVTGTGESLTIVPSNGLQTFLTNNDVKFDTRTTAEKKRKAKEKAESEKALKDAEKASLSTKKLEKAIEQAESIKESEYRKSSYANLASALKDAKKVMKDEDKTQAEVDSAEKKLNDAYGKLEKYTLFDKLKGPLFLGLGVALLAVIIGVAVSKAKKGKKVAKPKGKKPVAMPNDDSDFSEELRRMDEADLMSAQRRQSAQQPYQEPVMQHRNAYGQYEVNDRDLDVTDQVVPASLRTSNTNIPGVTFAEEQPDKATDLTNQRFGVPLNVPNMPIDSGDDETTILGHAPYLVRKDDGKEIPLRDGFIIGKEVNKVNYAITGNTSVSRTHAEFSSINGRFYIQDLESKNFTYLNGHQLPSYQKALLNNGDVIRLSNVEFTYYE